MRVQNNSVACAHRAKLQRLSSRSPPRPPALGMLNFSQKAGCCSPHDPGSTRDGIGPGPGPPPVVVVPPPVVLPPVVGPPAVPPVVFPLVAPEPTVPDEQAAVASRT